MIPLFGLYNIYWDFPLLMIAVSLVYSATRHDRWSRILVEAVLWIVRMVTFLGGLGLTLYILSSRPHLWPYAAGLFGLGTALYYAGHWWWMKKKAVASATNNPASEKIETAKK